MKTPINFLEYLEPDLGINILMWLYDPAELARASTTSRAWHYFVPFRNGERIGFSYLVSQKYCGDSAAIKVLRDSKIMNLNVKLGTPKKLVPAHNNGKHPSYYIIAGLVFLAVSVPYFHTEFGKEYKCEMPQSPNEEIVVISQVLMADITNGYEDIANTQVLAFNGQPVKNLKSLATMVESCMMNFRSTWFPRKF